MALARFKFLTSSQLKLILGCKSLSTVNSALRGLKWFRYPLVKSMDFWVAPWKWRLAPIHHLTKTWKDQLLEGTSLTLEEIQKPSWSAVFFQNDYFHRVSTVRFAVLFQKWLAVNNYGLVEMDLYFNSRYFDGQFHTATRTWSHGRVVEPDATAIYSAKGVYHTILFEQHNGRDAKRALKQIKQHCLWLLNERYLVRFTQRDDIRIIYLFENHRCMNVVMKWMMVNPLMRSIQHLFLFKDEDELQLSFADGWHHPDGTIVSFLPGAK